MSCLLMVILIVWEPRCQKWLKTGFCGLGKIYFADLFFYMETSLLNNNSEVCSADALALLRYERFFKMAAIEKSVDYICELQMINPHYRFVFCIELS